MIKIRFILVLLFGLFSCSKGITNSRVCSIDKEFDALRGCQKNFETFDSVPEFIVYSFIAKGLNINAKVNVYWFFEEQGKFTLIDSFSYHTKLPEELIVSGMERNFLQPGSYVVRTNIHDEDKNYDHEHRFTIQSSGRPEAHFILVGKAIDQNGLVTSPNTYFEKDHPMIYVSSYIYDAKPNTEIKIHFSHVEAGKFFKTFRTNTGNNPKSKFLLYAFLPNRNLPLGEYRVEIELDGKRHTAPFFIDATNENNQSN
jgi:hypothetical protein